MDLLSVYAETNRARMIWAAVLLTAAIALVDWWTVHYVAIGFFYLFPIIFVSGFLSPPQIVVAALACAVLQEAFSNLPQSEAVARLVFSSMGFVGAGLFISEMIRNRRSMIKHVEELEDQVKLREDAEQQLRRLIESSPAAIVTIDADGKVILGNEAAQQLLSPGGQPLQGQAIKSYLPSLSTVAITQSSRAFRTTLECTGHRSDGEVFLAGVWFSTYRTIFGPRLSAIIVDLSDDLRNREDLSLDNLLKNSRILMSTVTHEVRNLSSAALVAHKNLSRIKELDANEDFRALESLLQSLQSMSALELPYRQNGEAVELTSVLDELRILIGTTYRESVINVHWDIPDSLPLVWADRNGLVQVFLNLAKNSQRALMSSETKRFSIVVREENGRVVIRFEDTGSGVASPDKLFRPFQLTGNGKASGLGLYVSRAIMRSFGGELVYEPGSEGSGFAVILPLPVSAREGAHA